MNEVSSTVSDPSPGDRAVLLWRPDSDDSEVARSVEHAALLLGIAAEAVTAAIESGELLSGWFVDWKVPGTS
jgi:hypothetical protein